MHKTIFVMLAALVTVSQLAQAQKPAASGATVVASEPGKAVIASTVEATATGMPKGPGVAVLLRQLERRRE